MGYFPNGTSGEAYEEQWCDRCIHQNGPDGNSGCAVWFAHMLKNYDECNNDDSILHMLIPRTADHLWNEQCKMFLSAAEDHKSEGVNPTLSNLETVATTGEEGGGS